MITASKVAVVHACEGAAALPQRDENHPGQDEGNERHKEWEDAINAGRPPDVLAERWPGYTWRAEVALAIDLDTGKGVELGVGVGRNYGTLGPRAIAGTADAIGRGPQGELVVVDRKSFDPNVPRAAINAQLHTLALMACRSYGVDECQVAIAHELRPLDVAALDVGDLAQFEIDLGTIFDRAESARERVRNSIALKLTPGSHCRWCSAYYDCAAQQSLALDVRSGAAAMRVEEMMPLEDDATAARAYEFLKRVKMLSARLSSALHARAAERPIPLGDGRWFGKVPKLGKTKVDADIAYKVIREQHGQEIADAAVERKASQAGIKRGLEFVAGKSKFAEMMEEIRKRGGTKREPGEEIEEYAGEPKRLEAVG